MLKHKFHAKPCEKDGIKFPSLLEGRYYEKLKRLKEEGIVVGFFRQVPIDLPGGLKYVMDFLVFYADGTAEGIECKGFETKEWRIKEKLLKEAHPWFDLKIVKK